MPNSQAELINYARIYSALGFIPIPLKDKIPIISAWQKEPAGADNAARRLQGHDGNIGLALPDDLMVLDVDMKNGKNGKASLARLQDQYGELPLTLMQTTANDGLHYVFRKPADIELKNTSNMLGEGLDIRVRGGQIAAEPSKIGDKAYYWSDWDVLSGQIPDIAEAPQWLLKLISTRECPMRNSQNTQNSVGPGSFADSADAVNKHTIAEGERNNRLFRIAAAMYGRGNCESAILSQLRHENATRCTPPLPDKEIVAIARSIQGYPTNDDQDIWPELVPLDAPNQPRLDLVHLPGWAGDFSRAIAADTETPHELAAGMVLVACATAAARRLRVMVKPGYIEPCNLWIVVALPPGNRKSSVQTSATSPLLDWERDQATIMEPEIKRIISERKTMEVRAKEKRNKAAKEKDNLKAAELSREAADIEAELPDIPMQPQLWTSDATPERLGALLAEQGECMAWLSSEGGVFELLQGRYSNGIPNLDLVLKAHSGDAERVDRGSRPPVFLKSPRLSIGLSPQPDVLRGLAYKPGFRGRGLLGRFFYLLPPSPLGYRLLQSNPVPEAVCNAYAAGLRAMLDWEPAIDEHGNERLHLLRLSTEAREEWYEFAQAIEVQMRPGHDLEHFTDWAGKAPGAAARLAGVLHGIKHAHGRPWDAAITAETMNAALEIMAITTHHSLAALDMMGADPTIAAARLVWDWIERGRLDRFTVREAYNVLRGTFPRVAKLREALEALEERGYLEVIEPPRDGPGRPPSPIVRLRPGIARVWR
ncbi:MAG: DUF3987 domain-containing protein [Chromatiaceae bacterium]|nr:DUF3987 domain-containing protein [Chromatiaceae bacterium]